jgi:hypothetical protein
MAPSDKERAGTPCPAVALNDQQSGMTVFL